MDSLRLDYLLSCFESVRVAVFGDFFLDKYLDFDPAIAEVSVETGKTANQVVGVRHSPGAAGTVVSNLAAFRPQEILALGFVGDDGEGCELRRDLTVLGCDIDGLVVVPERHTPTYMKPRNVRVPGLEGEAERYDIKNRLTLPDWVEKKLAGVLEQAVRRVDALIVQDQVDEENCGVVTARIRETVEASAAANANVVFWVDSRQRIGCFRSVIVKPNEQEAVKAVFGPGEVPDDNSVEKAALALSEKSGKAAFVTRGSRGALIAHAGRTCAVRGFAADGPVDPTGAGDSFTAGAVLTLACGGTFQEAAILGNLCASLTVQQLGTTGTPKPDDLRQRLESWLAQNQGGADV